MTDENNDNNSDKFLFRRGDLVRLTAGEGKGRHAFILDDSKEIETDDRKLLRVTLDRGRPMDGSPWQPTTIEVHKSDFKLVAKAEEPIRVRICDYYSNTVDMLGFAASTDPVPFPIDQESTLALLHRPSSQELPGPHKKIDAIFKDSKTESLYRALFSGKNLVVDIVQEFDSDQLFEACILSLSVTVYMTQADDTLLEIGLLQMRPFFKSRVGRDDIAVELWLDMCDESTIHLMPNQREALKARFFHLVLRVAGCRIDQYIFFFAVCLLNHVYLSRNWQKEALYLALVHADMISQTRPDCLVDESLPHMATILEACCKFREAASIHGQCANIYAAHLDKTTKRSPLSNEELQFAMSEVKMCLSQGFASAAGNDMEGAEKAYLRALRIVFQSFPTDPAFSHDAFRASLTGLLQVYWDWVQVLPDGKQAEQLNELGVLLSTTTLSLQAALRNSTHSLPANLLANMKWVTSSMTCKLCKNTSVPKLKTKLKQAFLADSVSVFRARARAWKTEHVKIPIQRGQAHPRRASIKEAARAELISGVDSDLVFLTCDNTGCNDGYHKVEMCDRCQSVNYCSKDCQVAHWEVHRPDCKRIRRALAEGPESKKAKTSA